jgi:hypothetical protein
MSTAASIKSQLRRFVGGGNRYSLSPLFPTVLFTEGVNYLCREAECDWLLSAIASHLECEPSLRKEWLLTWTLHFDRERGDTQPRCTIVATGTRDETVALVEHRIAVTSLDPEFDGTCILAGWDGSCWHLYLLSEH